MKMNRFAAKAKDDLHTIEMIRPNWDPCGRCEKPHVTKVLKNCSIRCEVEYEVAFGFRIVSSVEPILDSRYKPEESDSTDKDA
jgi:hypothetical protein